MTSILKIFSFYFLLSVAFGATTKKTTPPKLLQMALGGITRTTTTTTTTTTQWVFVQKDGTPTCNGYKFQLGLNFSTHIDSVLAGFNAYFMPYPVKNNIANTPGCCSLCGTPLYKRCIAFDYNIQTKSCQMYQIRTHQVPFTVSPNGKEYFQTYYDGQAYFLYSNNFLVPQANHVSGIFYQRDYDSYIGVN